jgi:hypothetical protein
VKIILLSVILLISRERKKKISRDLENNILLLDMSNPGCEDALTVRVLFYIEKIIRGFVEKDKQILFKILFIGIQLLWLNILGVFYYLVLLFVLD